MRPLTKESASEVARWLAVAAGYDLADYDDPEVTERDGSWTAHFLGRTEAPGDHFLVTLEHEGHRSRITPGR